MSKALPIVLNVLAFNALWTLAMFGAGSAWWWVAPIAIVASALVQLAVSPSAQREGSVIACGALVGVGGDLLGSSMGIVHYQGGSRVEFLVVFAALWINFGTTLRPSLSWMWRRPALAAMLGGVGGPCAYWVGERIGAIALCDPLWRALLWVGLQYALALPLWMLAASWFMSSEDGTVHASNERSTMRGGHT